MGINMNSIINIIIVIDNMVVTFNTTIKHDFMGISIMINTVSIDPIINKLPSAHDVVIDSIITINVLLLLIDMHTNIINIRIITNSINIVSNCVHFSNTDCK